MISQRNRRASAPARLGPVAAGRRRGAVFFGPGRLAVAAGRWRLLTHTEPYRTMPLSAADGHFTAQAFAFAVA